MGRGLVGKGQNGHWAKWESSARWLLGEMKVGENEIVRNGKRAGQILGGMGKGRNGKVRTDGFWAK